MIVDTDKGNEMKKMNSKEFQESFKLSIQSFVDQILKKEKIDDIKIKFTNRRLKGDAYYQSYRSKGKQINTPVYIMIGVILRIFQMNGSTEFLMNCLIMY